MQPRIVARSLAAAVVTAVAVSAGLAACTARTASPAVPATDASFDVKDLLAGAWTSTADGAAHLQDTFPDKPPPEIPRPEGWLFQLRGRCTGTGVLSTRVSGASGFANTNEWRCTGKWIISMGSFPPGSKSGPDDPGPFTLVVDRPDTITSWDLEAYAIRVANVYPYGPGVSPA